MSYSFAFRTASLMFLLLATSGLAGCKNDQNNSLLGRAKGFTTQDREIGYDREDYREAMAPRPLKKRDSLDIPDMAPVISEDRKNVLPQPLVSITVNQDVPIRDIFFELAKQAEVDLELDPTISGSLIFTAYNRPFDQVVERITDMSGLRYQFKNNVLRVERDTPYNKTYHINTTGLQRDYTSSINSSTSTSSGGSGGSSSSISSSSKSDFWVELEANIKQIVDSSNLQTPLIDPTAPVTTPQAIPAVSSAQLAAIDGQQGGATAPAAAAPAATSAPAAAAPAAAAPAAAGGGSSGQSNPYFSINRQASIVNVFATERQHKRIKAYIDETLRVVNTQVLIEAKVFEVELNDENSLGIDWSIIDDLNAGGSIRNGAGISLDRLSFTEPVGTNTGAVLALATGDTRFVLNAISRFGTVRALSSPRLSVMNNQTALLNVSESRVFFDVKLERTEGTNNNPPRLDVTSSPKNVPEGLIITVHPSVDPDTNEITMNLRPSITRVVRSVSDPGVAFIAQQNNVDIENLVPELSVREIDSVVRMASGKTIVMGGLMQDRTEGTQQSVPVLGEIPVVGPLFRSQRDVQRKTEMVIMIRATVVNAPSGDDTDRELYKKMGQDRHPFDM